MDSILKRPNSQLENILKYLRTRLNVVPKFSITSGSGFSDIWTDFKVIDIIPYEEISDMPLVSVSGHSNVLFVIEYKGVPGLVFGGRFHLYEGHDLNNILIPVLVPINLGIKNFIFMNAAGGLNPQFEAGDIMIIDNMINFTNRKVHSLFHPEILQSKKNVNTFDEDWINILENKLVERKIKFNKGTYLCVTGPSYETPAEIRTFRRFGADAVGMSTVLESQAGSLAGANILAFSVITNVLKEKNTNKLTHNEVIETLQKSKKNVKIFIESALEAKFISSEKQ